MHLTLIKVLSVDKMLHKSSKSAIFFFKWGSVWFRENLQKPFGFDYVTRDAFYLQMLTKLAPPV